MSEKWIEVPIPLDSGFLRRECPNCLREFKVLPTEDEIGDLFREFQESYLLKAESSSSGEDGDGESEGGFFCPYCGQPSGPDNWWTQEQLNYMMIFAKNVMARIVNEDFIQPLNRDLGRQSSGAIGIRFEGHDLPYEDPWISPEDNDMKVFELPCCQRSLKIVEDWSGKVHCFFCGFPHRPSQTESISEG